MVNGAGLSCLFSSNFVRLIVILWGELFSSSLSLLTLLLQPSTNVNLVDVAVTGSRWAYVSWSCLAELSGEGDVAFALPSSQEYLPDSSFFLLMAFMTKLFSCKFRWCISPQTMQIFVLTGQSSNLCDACRKHKRYRFCALAIFIFVSVSNDPFK